MQRAMLNAEKNGHEQDATLYPSQMQHTTMQTNVFVQRNISHAKKEHHLV